MSIRPNIFGVNLQQFIEQFGKTEAAEAKEIFEKYENSLVVIDNERSYDINKTEDEKLIVEALTEGGAKAVDLEDSHFEIIDCLLNLQSEIIFTDSNEWRYYHQEYFEGLTEKVDAKIKMLIEYFLEGRKIFETGITRTELPYAYLTLSEEKQLLDDMSLNWDKYNDSEGFGKQLKEWVEEFVGKGKDLIFTQG